MAGGHNHAVGVNKAYVDANGAYTTNPVYNIYPLTNTNGLTYGTGTTYTQNADLLINGTSMNEIIETVNKLVKEVEELKKLLAVKQVDEESYDVD